MATKKVTKPAAKQPKASATSPSRRQVIRERLASRLLAIRQRKGYFLARRPHRSFRRTRRRDHVRSLRLPGYWAFTNEVRVMLWQQRRTFIWVVVVYGFLSALMVGLASQDTYTTLSDTLRDTSGDIFKGNWGEIGKAGLLFVTTIQGGLPANATEAQQIYTGIISLLVWLTTVWLLRGIMAGQRPGVRDGFYNAGAPIVPTSVISLIFIVQLIPAALAVIAFSAAISSGFLEGGVEAMIFTVLAGLLIILSVYWVTSTLIALVVATLPGMYPLRALKTAGDLVIGRRLRILLRWVWLAALVLVTWAIITVPIIIFDTWLKGVVPALKWLPLVPVSLLVLSSFTIVAIATYVYLLYRRIVDDDAAPA